jgi:cysteine desulfurase/selenocysteine lyase
MKDDINFKFQKARELFPHTKEVSYLNSAAYGPFASTVSQAIMDNVKLRTDANQDDSHFAFSTADELRQDFASMIGAAKKQVGLAFNTTYGLNLAAYGLPLKRGDEVLLSDIEFPAAVYTWQGAATARGLKIRLIKSHNLRFDIDEFIKAIRPNSRVLCLSFVQFFNGYKNDLETISEICKKHKIFFVVDGIQGMGVEPINVRKLGIDIFASGCQKWMLGPHGTGFFYLSDEIRDRMIPPFMTWLSVDWGMNFGDLLHFDRPYFDSARRFETGSYPAMNIGGVKEAVKIFQSLEVYSRKFILQGDIIAGTKASIININFFMSRSGGGSSTTDC